MSLSGPTLPINGTVSLAVNDNNGNPTSVLEGSLPWSVTVSWTLNGGGSLLTPYSKWRVRVYLESMGDGFEGQVGSMDVSHPNTSAAVSIPGPIGSSSPTNVNPSGVYRVVAVITLFYNDPVTGAVVPQPVAGFAEGPIIQFQ